MKKYYSKSKNVINSVFTKSLTIKNTKDHFIYRKNNADFDGHVDLINENEIIGWAIDLHSRSSPVYICVIQNDVVLCVTKTSETRIDVERVHGPGHSSGFHVVMLDRKNYEGSVRVLAIDAKTGLQMATACEQRDQLTSGSEIYLSKYLNGNNTKIFDLPINKNQNLFNYHYKFPGDEEIINLSAVFLVEITDLLNYLRAHSTVTGIQRTVCGFIAALLGATGNQYKPFRFCYLSENLGYVAIFDNKSIGNLIHDVFAGGLTVAQLSLRVEELLRESQQYKPKAGNNLIISGAYWIVSRFDQKIAAIKKNGAIVGIYIYDLIPITGQQWVTTNTNRAVQESAYSAFYLSDYFITISNFVRDDLIRVLDFEMNIVKPIGVAQLPHTMPKNKEAHQLKNISIQPDPYVLCVCTIEGRKNHILLFRIWAALIRKYSYENVPNLVLVGKWGWRIDEFREACELSNNLNGKIIILSNVSDPELIGLYSKCLFTVFPSFLEGWGLPVGESLSFGKLCVASNAASIPEVGEKFADYFDPYDFNDAMRKIDRAIFDINYLENRTKFIESDFEPRTWEVMTSTLMSGAIKLAHEVSASPSLNSLVPPMLEPGKVWSLVGLVDSPLTSWKDKKVRFAFTKGWSNFEDWGIWSQSKNAEISFRTPLPSETPIKLWIKMRLPNNHCGEEIAITSSGKKYILPRNELPNNLCWIEIEVCTEVGGIVTLNLCRPYRYGKVEPSRIIYCGVSDICYCSVGDATVELIMARRMMQLLVAERVN